MKISIYSASSDQTETIASNIGRHLRGGEVIELRSDLGGGKTTFTRGLAKAIGSSDKVASPTFTISRTYNGDKINIQHLDFYRLNKDDFIVHEFMDTWNNQSNVVVIEWADLVANVLPKNRLKIDFKYSGQFARELRIFYPKNLAYLMSDYVNTSHKNLHPGISKNNSKKAIG